jgi:hypothetical protein
MLPHVEAEPVHVLGEADSLQVPVRMRLSRLAIIDKLLKGKNALRYGGDVRTRKRMYNNTLHARLDAAHLNPRNSSTYPVERSEHTEAEPNML